MWRRSTQVRETTPYASGNVWNELERAANGLKFVMEQRVEPHDRAALNTTKTSSNECNALQRTAGRLLNWK